MTDLFLLQPPDWVSTNPKMYFPLSLCYLAGAVEQAGFSVEVLDFRCKVDEMPKAQFYGFSCGTPQIEIGRELSAKVRRKGSKTIIGGAHASLLPEDCVKDFDYVVCGEGEEILPLILKGWVEPGIVKARRIEDLDSIALPARNKVAEPFSFTLFPGERYGKGELAATLISSRGCPFDCAFCGNIFRKPITYHSPERMEKEIEVLIDQGVRHYRFEDDNFMPNPGFKQMCVMLEEHKIHYKCHTRSDLVKPLWAMVLKASGCEECGLGVESADDEVLMINNKKETAEQHKEAIKVLKEVGIRIKTYFVMGLPGETDETLEINKEFIFETKPDKWTISTFTPYPGCDIFAHPEVYEVTIVNRDWSKWWNYCQDGYNHVLWGQTPEQMWKRYKDFYDFMRGETWK